MPEIDIHLHPALVHFPIALFLSAFIFELLSLIFKNENLKKTAFQFFFISDCVYPADFLVWFLGGAGTSPVASGSGYPPQFCAPDALDRDFEPAVSFSHLQKPAQDLYGFISRRFDFDRRFRFHHGLQRRPDGL